MGSAGTEHSSNSTESIIGRRKFLTQPSFDPSHLSSSLSLHALSLSKCRIQKPHHFSELYINENLPETEPGFTGGYKTQQREEKETQFLFGNKRETQLRI